jgi:hypothetical protein
VNITHFQDIREHHQLSGYSVRGWCSRISWKWVMFTNIL